MCLEAADRANTTVPAHCVCKPTMHFECLTTDQSRNRPVSSQCCASGQSLQILYSGRRCRRHTQRHDCGCGLGFLQRDAPNSLKSMSSSSSNSQTQVHRSTRMRPRHPTFAADNVCKLCMWRASSSYRAPTPVAGLAQNAWGTHPLFAGLLHACWKASTSFSHCTTAPTRPEQQQRLCQQPVS